MSIFHKIAIALAGLLLIIIAVLTSLSFYQSRKIDKIEQQNTVLTADSAADSTYVREHKRIVREQRENNEQVDAVLEQNRAWADQPVPDDVADLLREHPDAAEGVPR